MRLSVMASSTIYTNHSSSFMTAKLFEETGSALDVPSMAGSSRNGLLITMILVCSGQVLDTSLSQSNGWFKLGLVQMSIHWMHLSGWLWFGTLTTNLQFPSTSFCHISQMDNRRAWMMFVFFFLPLDVFELLSTFLQNHIWLWYFSLFSNLFLPLHSHSVLHAVSKQLLCNIKFCWRRRS